MEGETGKFRILAMPDIFLDHYMAAGTPDDFAGLILATASAGSRMRVPQHLSLGGNAYNFAFAAARLGCSVALLARTSRYLLDLVLRETAGLDFSTEYVTTGFEPSLTVALEFRQAIGGRSVNINHPGSLQEAGPEMIPDELSGHHFDMVAVFNLTNNTLGTRLAQRAFSSLGGLKLMDLPDASSPFKDPDGLSDSIGLADAISASVEEGIAACSLLGLGEGLTAVESASELSRLGPVVGLHSQSESLEARDGVCTRMAVDTAAYPSTTGAGDFWTAAYALSLLRLDPPDRRLAFANEQAGAMLAERKKAMEKWFGAQKSVPR